jgi:SAM-dependent methyltransferase
MPGIFWWISGLSLVGGVVCYWLLVLSEGTFLGTRVVAWLYDLTANQYDAIKKNRYIYEARYIGIPLVQALEQRNCWRLLDVAGGTGRVSLSILAAGSENSLLWCIDRSLKMLRFAQHATSAYPDRVVISQQEATRLAFEDKSFDGVTCLEALEFMPQPRKALTEMMRVLKPDGILLLSNRVGLDALIFPGRMCGRGRLENELRRLGLVNIRTVRWQEHYDLVWAVNPARQTES